MGDEGVNSRKRRGEFNSRELARDEIAARRLVAGDLGHNYLNARGWINCCISHAKLILIHALSLPPHRPSSGFVVRQPVISPSELSSTYVSRCSAKRGDGAWTFASTTLILNISYGGGHFSNCQHSFLRVTQNKVQKNAVTKQTTCINCDTLTRYKSDNFMRTHNSLVEI